MAQQLSATAPQDASAVHPHPIRWDADRQLWVCTQGCDFTRVKREGEVVPTREEAHAEAARAGSGADFLDLGAGARPGAGPRKPAPAGASEPIAVSC
jgi:hypothetical protein